MHTHIIYMYAQVGMHTLIPNGFLITTIFLMCTCDHIPVVMVWLLTF